MKWKTIMVVIISACCYNDCI